MTDFERQVYAAGDFPSHNATCKLVEALFESFELEAEATYQGDDGLYRVQGKIGPIGFVVENLGRDHVRQVRT